MGKIKDGLKKVGKGIHKHIVTPSASGLAQGSGRVGVADYMGYIRAVFKTMGYIFIALGTLFIFGPAPGLKFIPLFVLSFAIMTYPSGTVSTDEEVGLAVLKMILGIMMIAVFSYIFIGLLGTAPILLFSLVCIAIGFFLVIPQQATKNRNDPMSKMLDNLASAGDKAVKKMMSHLPGFGSKNFIFKLIIWFVLGIVVLFLIINILGATGDVGLPGIGSESAMEFNKILTIITGLGMGIFSILIGIKLGKNLNGQILGIAGGAGLFLGTIALMNDFVMFIAFSMVVGMGILSAVPVDKAKTFIGIPILIVALMTTTFAYPDVMGTAVFGQWWPEIDYTIDNTFGPLLENIQSPLGTLGSGYECLINPVGCYEDYQPETSTKESIRSVEVTRLDAISETTIGDDFVSPLLIIVTVENRGKETAENIRVIPIEPVYTQGIEGEEEVNSGTVEIRCQDGSISDHKTGCNIPKLITGEIREFVLSYYIDTLVSGSYIAYGADIYYDLELTGQVDVMVMNEDDYLKLSKNNKLVRREQVTEDTGGPVRLGLALMRNEMPVRDDLEGVPVLLYLNNQGPGTIENVYEDSVKVDINDLYVDTGEAGMYCTPGKKPAGREDLELRGLEKITNPDDDDDKMKTGEHIGATCISRVPDITVEQKTFAITGEIKYNYSHGMQREIHVEFVEDTPP